jgi:hypothetical protein
LGSYKHGNEISDFLKAGNSLTIVQLLTTVIVKTNAFFHLKMLLNFKEIASS